MDKIKVVIVGEDAVGKTSIIDQYVNEIFSEEYLSTIGADRMIKEIEINNQTLNLEIWDTVGQKDYRVVNKMYMKNVQIGIVVYSIINRKTFQELNYWINALRNINKKDIIIGIVGNKNDLYEEREVEEEEGKEYAKRINALFFETSAKEYGSIENVFIKMCELYLEKKEEEKAIKEGKKVIKYDNGDKYIGFIFNNKREGNGKMKYNNGNIYEGNWKNNIFINGKIKYNNRDVYEGNINNNKREGKGIMKYNNGDIYEGYFKNDLKEGKGKLYFKEGYYEGEWKNNELNGKGKIYYNNNKIFEGYFINGKREGKGIIKNKNNNDILELNFKDDKIEGEGILIYNNGNILIGKFDNNNYNPIKGRLNYLNGDSYEGNFDENGNRKGEGKIRNKNGKIYYCEFYNNNEGLFCVNENDYNILKDKNINDINEIFKLNNINDIFYKGKYDNNKKEGKGLLYMKKNELNYKMIYEGNFKNDLKEGFGKIYYETGSIFESYWIEDEIDKEKESIFHLTNLNKFINNKLNKNEWINFINIQLFNNIGNINLKNLSKSIIR